MKGGRWSVDGMSSGDKMQSVDLSGIACGNVHSANCSRLHLRMESTYGVGDTMFIFNLFQNGLIFSALIAGLFSICHIIYCRAVICRNSTIVLVLILTGFCHMLVCVYLLQMSERSAMFEVPKGGNHNCTDYYLPATLANTITLTAIVHNLIRLNIKPTILAALVRTVSIGSIVAGLLCIIRLHDYFPPIMHQDTFVTVGNANETHLDIFWSICQKEVSAEKIRMLAEYGLIYTPIVIIVLIAWYKSYKMNKDLCLLKIRIIDTSDCDDEVHICVCSKLGPSFVAILAYSALILFIARPGMIIYAYASTGYFRDILPSLLHTVMYCFICSEYLTKAFKIQRRLSTVHNKCSKRSIIHV